MNISLIKERISFDLDIKNNIKLLNNEIKGKKCLIIGGAGTIGSNYIKCLLEFKPSLIVVVDINENGLAELTRDLRSSSLLDYQPDYITYPVNLLSKTFDKIFNNYYFDIIANFSAHKHVRSEKDIISIEALIKNNVYGAIKLLKMCNASPPKHFFSVSTDKAANPVNIMGASKSLMEKIIISKKNDFKVSTARFANVIFSNGSLLDSFINRLNKQQPLSCPSDIKRFFVTPKQSGQICLLSTFIGKSGSIFFPKLNFENDQLFFKDLALKFLKINGYNPKIVKSEMEGKNFNFSKNSKDYPIYFFKTDTSGEKTYEEFYTENETFDLKKFNSLGYIQTPEIKISFEEIIETFDFVFNNQGLDKKDIILNIKKYVPDFNHIETGKHLDQKM